MLATYRLLCLNIEIRMAENRRPLYAIIEKIDIESWETGIYQLRMDRVCILNLLYFWKNHQTCPIWKKSCSTCLLKKFIFPNKHRFRILPDNPSLSNLDYYTYYSVFFIFSDHLEYQQLEGFQYKKRPLWTIGRSPNCRFMICKWWWCILTRRRHHFCPEVWARVI